MATRRAKQTDWLKLVGEQRQRDEQIRREYETRDRDEEGEPDRYEPWADSSSPEAYALSKAAAERRRATLDRFRVADRLWEIRRQIWLVGEVRTEGDGYILSHTYQDCDYIPDARGLPTSTLANPSKHTTYLRVRRSALGSIEVDSDVGFGQGIVCRKKDQLEDHEIDERLVATLVAECCARIDLGEHPVTKADQAAARVRRVERGKRATTGGCWWMLCLPLLPLLLRRRGR